MVDNPQVPQSMVFWSQDHKIIYANAFQFRFSENDISIDLGTSQNINNGNNILSAAQLVLSLKPAKMFSFALAETLRQFEEQFGEIELDEDKAAQMAKSIAQSLAVISGSKASKQKTKKDTK